MLEPGAAGEAVGVVVVGPSGEQLPLVVHGVERAVLVHGNAGVEEHVVVRHEVRAPVLVEEVHVRAELVGGADRLEEVVHDAGLLGGELVGPRRVERGEVTRAQLVGPPAHLARPALRVDVPEQQPVLHPPVGMARDGLPLQLEEDDGDGLLHRAHPVVGAIGRLREERELAQRHSVGALQDLEAVIVDVVADDGGKARGGPCGCAHPHDVMVAPLQVDGVVAHEAVDDLVGVRTAVEHVADDVEVVHREALHERGEAHDEVVCRARLNDRVDDAPMVALALVALPGGGVEQLVDDVGVLDGHGAAHLGARVGVGEEAREAHEAHERDRVPLVRGSALLPQAAELAVGVVDEGAEVGLLSERELKAERVRHALSNDAGAVGEDVLERLVLAVHVRDKVLGALRQVEDGLEVDDLRVRRARGGELLGQELEVLAAGFCL